MPEESWSEYVTQKPHGNHPAGTKCRARREVLRRLVVLKFEDGEVIELPGARFYLPGIEQRSCDIPTPVYEDPCPIASSSSLSARTTPYSDP